MYVCMYIYIYIYIYVYTHISIYDFLIAPFDVLGSRSRVQPWISRAPRAEVFIACIIVIISVIVIVIIIIIITLLL